MAKAKAQTGFAALVAKQEKSKTTFKEQKQQERDELHAVIEKRLPELAANPREYLAYLNLQALHDFSPKNILLVLERMPEAQDLRSELSWVNMGRSVAVTADNSVKIFAPSKYTHVERKEMVDAYGVLKESTISYERNGYEVAYYYDVSQTKGGEYQPKEPLGEEAIDQAVQNMFYRVPKNVKVAETPQLDVIALYEPSSQIIHVRLDGTAAQTYSEFAAAIAHAKLHEKHGVNYSREAYDLDAQSIAYVLCKRNGIECQTPDMTPHEKWSGLSVESLESRLQDIRRTANSISGRSQSRSQSREPRQTQRQTR